MKAGILDKGGKRLQHAVAGAADDVVLLFLRQGEELDGVAGNADGEVRVFGLFGVRLRVEQLFHAEHVHVQVVCALGEVAVHHGHELLGAFLVAMAEGVRANRLRIADAVERVFVRELRDGVERCQEAVPFRTRRCW